MVSYQTIKERAVAVNEQAAGAAGAAEKLSDDEQRLHELGYAQELRRRRRSSGHGTGLSHPRS
jgi:hypothetical protein